MERISLRDAAILARNLTEYSKFEDKAGVQGPKCVFIPVVDSPHECLPVTVDRRVGLVQVPGTSAEVAAGWWHDSAVKWTDWA